MEITEHVSISITINVPMDQGTSAGAMMDILDSTVKLVSIFVLNYLHFSKISTILRYFIKS